MELKVFYPNARLFLDKMYDTSIFDQVDIIHYRMGLALFTLKRYDEAHEAFRCAYDINPNFTQAQKWIEKLDNLNVCFAQETHTTKTLGDHDHPIDD